MKESLFKAVPQRQGAIMNGETTFEFLQRGGRMEAIEIRQWIEKWYQKHFAIHDGVDLKKRLKSKDFGNFMGAYFELQIFAMLRLLDCDVKIHPDFKGTGGTVDFCAIHGEGRFYMEATVCGINHGILRSNVREEDAVRKITKQ